MASLRQKKVLKLVTEKHRSISRAMLEAGYSPNTASKPKNLTETKSWKELLDKYLPDDFVLNAINEDIDGGAVGNRTPILTLATKLKGKLVDKVEQDAKIKVDINLPKPVDELV